MAQAKRKTEWETQTPVTGAIDHAIAVPSPARALQQLLDERTAAADGIARWSRRRSLAFVVTTSSALWLAILAMVHGAVQLA